MFTAIRKILNKPFPFYFNNQKENLWLALGTAIFAVLFIEVFHPFDIAKELDHPKIIYGLITFFVLSFDLVLIPRWLPAHFENWTLGRFIGYNLICIVCIAFLVSLYHYFVSFRDLQINFGELVLVDLFHTFLIGILPLFLMFFLISNRMLLRNLKKANQVNAKLLKYRQQIGDQSDKPAEIRSDTHEKLSLNLATLLYAEAEDNYSKIVWQDDGQVKEHLLRITLGRLEEQIGSDQMVRCHRSFIVNLNKLSSVEGNASGYRLHLNGTDHIIPVSRARSHQLSDWFETFSLKSNGLNAKPG